MDQNQFNKIIVLLLVLILGVVVFEYIYTIKLHQKVNCLHFEHQGRGETCTDLYGL